MKSPLSQLLLRWLVMAIGVVLAARLVPGISYANNSTLFVVVLLLSFFNAVLRPVFVVLTLPFILLTMGLGVIVINALLFYWVGRLVDGFVVHSFWSALGGAIIVGITNLVFSSIMKKRQGPGRTRRKPDDVIDI